MRSRLVVNLVLLLMPLLLRYGIEASTAPLDTQNVGRDFFEKTLLQLMHQRRLFMDGFGNGTATIQRDFSFGEAAQLDTEAGEGRARRKKLRRMNKTLLAIVMAYTLKFMFLIPTFIGTLILLKFTTALAGFFYALFAAVIGLDHHRDH